jgi:hypothetical protein
MTTDGVELAAPAAPEPKPNSFSRIAGVFFAPGETFASIVRRPDFVVPLVIIFVFSVITGILVAQKVDFKDIARQAVESNPRSANLSPDIQQKQVNLMGGIMKAAAYASPVLSIVLLVVLAAILFAAFKMFGGEGEFLQALSVTIYAWFPNIVRGIVSVAAVLSKKSLTLYSLQNPVASNFAYFISNPRLHPVEFAFLSAIDLFTIWTLILLIIGFSTMSRFSRAKSAVIVLSLWAIKVLFAVGGGAVQALQLRGK